MRKRWIGGAWAVLAASLLAGCQSNHRSAGGPGRATLSHVVLCWLKEPGDAAQRQRLIETSKTFRELPGVVSVDVGEAIPSTRPVVDSSFDVALVMRFEDRAALQAYETHPKHQKAVNEVLRPLTSRILVYDVLDR
jgi:hypothetical protein